MGNSGKIFTIVIVVIIGVIILALIQKAGGGGMGFFGLFGVAVFFIIKMFFKNNELKKDTEEKIPIIESDIITKKDSNNKYNDFTKEQIFAIKALKFAQKITPQLPEYLIVPTYGYLEIILYNSVVILNILKENPKLGIGFSSAYFHLLFDYVLDFGTGLNYDKMKKFIGERIDLYENIIKILPEHGDIGSKAYSAFYINPLSESPEICLNIERNIIFCDTLNEMNLKIKSELNELINNTL